jgi:hypothetical protein
MLAIVTFPEGYDTSGIVPDSIKANGVPPEWIGQTWLIPRIFAATFRLEKLNLQPGENVRLTITGKIRQGSSVADFQGYDTVRVVS